MSELHHHLLELLGEDMTLRLIEGHGGTRVYVPVGPDVGTLKLANELSPAAEIALAREYGGILLRIPLSKAWRAHIYRRRGMKHPEIARRLGCTERAVLAYLKPAQAIIEQMSMQF